MCMYKYTHISMKSWNWKLLSRVLLFAIHGLYSPWNSLGQNTGVGSLSLLQGILPTQGTSPGLPHGRQILYQLSHEASPRILEWVAYPFSTRFSRPRNRTGVSRIAGRFFINWAIREAHEVLSSHQYFQFQSSLKGHPPASQHPISVCLFSIVKTLAANIINTFPHLFNALAQ